MSRLNLGGLLDKLISQSEVVETAEGRYVLKSFWGEKSSIKWLPVTALLSPIYPFAFNPRERLRRELDFFNAGWSSFKTPRILEIDEENYRVVREYVDGRQIDIDMEARKLGLAMGEVHERGWALGDTKPTNFLVGSDGTLYIIDAEQAVKDAEKHHAAWDIYLIIFIASYMYIRSPGVFEEFVREFISGHSETCKRSEIYGELSSAKFEGLLILLPPSHLYKLVKITEGL